MNSYLEFFVVSGKGKIFQAFFKIFSHIDILLVKILQYILRKSKSNFCEKMFFVYY
jgi:hypothetical protein